MAVAGMAGMPDKEVRKLVNEFGRNRAIDMLAEWWPTRRLAEVLSDQQVARSVRDDGRAGDRRPRTAGTAMTGLAALETSGQ